MEANCDICGKVAVSNCSKCGKPLCQKHINHGVSLRTNAPTIDCPRCKTKMGKKIHTTSIIMIIMFIIIVVFIIFYFNSIFGFF